MATDDNSPKPDQRFTAMGAVNTLLSGFAGRFDKDYQGWGFALAGLSALLTAYLIYAEHRIAIPSKIHRRCVYSAVCVVFGISAILMTSSYSHSKMFKPSDTVATPAPAAVSHDTYTLSTTGKDSPNITGSGGTYNIGDSNEKPTPKANKQQ